MKKLITILILSGLLLPIISIAKEETQIQIPETIEEAGEMGEKALEISKEELPKIIEDTWKKEVLPIWKKMWNWFSDNIWTDVKSWFERVIKPKIEEEVEKRKPLIEEEFQKEKDEIKEDLPKIGESLWEKFKDLLK